MSRNDLLDEDGENRALRSFLMQYGLPGLTVAAMAQHMRRSGWESEYWPVFARQVDNGKQHLTKGGAQVWIRHLLAMEPVAARELDVEAELRRLSAEYEEKRQRETNPNMERILLGAREGLDMAVAIVSAARSAAQSTATVSTEQAGDAPRIPRENNDKLIELARYWKLDGDWMTCKGCKRSLIASRDGEELNHADGCKFAAQQHPWARLRALVAPSPNNSPVGGKGEQ